MGRKKSGKKAGGEDKKVQEEPEPQAQQSQAQQPVPSTSRFGPSSEIAEALPTQIVSQAPSVQQVTEEIPEPQFSLEQNRKNRKGKKKHSISSEQEISEKLSELQISDEPLSQASGVQHPRDKGSKQIRGVQQSTQLSRTDQHRAGKKAGGEDKKVQEEPEARAQQSQQLQAQQSVPSTSRFGSSSEVVEALPSSRQDPLPDQRVTQAPPIQQVTEEIPESTFSFEQSRKNKRSRKKHAASSEQEVSDKLSELQTSDESLKQASGVQHPRDRGSKKIQDQAVQQPAQLSRADQDRGLQQPIGSQQPVGSQDRRHQGGDQDKGTQPTTKRQDMSVWQERSLQPGGRDQERGDRQERDPQQRIGSQDSRRPYSDQDRISQQPIGSHDSRRQYGDQDKGSQPSSKTQDRSVWQEHSLQQPRGRGRGRGDRQERDPQQRIGSQGRRSPDSDQSRSSQHVGGHDRRRQYGDQNIGSQPSAKGQDRSTWQEHSSQQPGGRGQERGDRHERDPQQRIGSQETSPYSEQDRSSQQAVGSHDRRRQYGDQDTGSQPSSKTQDRGVWQEHSLQQPRGRGGGRGDRRERYPQQHIGSQDRRSPDSDQSRSSQHVGGYDRRRQYGDQDKGPQSSAKGQDRSIWQERSSQQPGGRGQERGDRQERDPQQRIGSQETSPDSEQDRSSQQAVGSHDRRRQDGDQDKGSQPSAKGQDRGVWQQRSFQQPGGRGQDRGDRQERDIQQTKGSQHRGSIQPTQPPQKLPTQPPQKEAFGMSLAVPERKQRNSAGTSGRKIYIETNHLALTLKNLKSAFHYDVVIEPDTPRKLLRVAVEQFRCRNYPTRYPAFDGRRNLYSASILPISDGFTDEVSVKDDDRQRNYKITIKFASQVDLSIVNKYFELPPGSRHMVTPQEAIQCLDIVLRSAPSLNIIPVGRSFFTQPEKIIPLGDGMEMYYGYYQSAILGWKPYLNVDVSHKAFPKSDVVSNIIKELCPGCDLDSPLKPYQTEIVDKFMRTLKVQYEIPHMPATKRVMRVNQLDKPANLARFKTDKGKELTVEEYFQIEKKYRLRYPHLSCLWVGSKQREQKILLPPELCTILPGQVTQRQMTPTQTSNMIRYSATSTTDRKKNIMNSVQHARYNEDPSVREFGFSVSHEFTQIGARVLDPPTLTYDRGTVNPKKGVWRSSKFLKGVKLDKWGVLSIDDRSRDQVVSEFTTMLMKCARGLGMEISEPSKVLCNRLPHRQPQTELETMFLNYKDFRLVFVIIPSDGKDIYNYVKQVAELKVGALTQCVKGRNIFRPKESTVMNILLKVNAKLNGVNYKLYVRPKCLERPCMIMGADVTHPSPDNKGTIPSVAAVTASHDAQAFQYNICWRLQPPAQEIISDLKDIVKEHLLYFYKANRAKPERIIFFRDGVSEGQFEIVLNSEINTIREACTTMGDGSYKPKITFLVVQKRHHTRFFPLNPRDSEDKNFNVPAGTVVDTEITHPTALDFYLVSHASIQGVARPTKYRMLWDDNDMNEDELEQLTYHLCHVYARCTRSVSYPAPTYYAHLAAARAKVYCEKRQINMNSLDREFANLRIKDEILKGFPMFFI